MGDRMLMMGVFRQNCCSNVVSKCATNQRGIMKQREAKCSCGQLTVKVEGDPIRVSICHCQACQRRTGGVFGVQARFPTGNVKIAGQSSEYVRAGDSGKRIYFQFCPSCGATVYYRFESSGEYIGVPVGAFADPEFPPPAFSVFEALKHPWVQVPEDIEHHP